MELTRTQQIIIAASMLAVLLVAGLLTVVRGCGNAGVIVTDSADTPPRAFAQQAATCLTVHVAGAVRRPGVYYLLPGAHVYDAVRAAGGFNATADQQALNLAAELEDSRQVFVPSLSRVRAPTSSTPSRAQAPRTPPTASSAPDLAGPQGPPPRSAQSDIARRANVTYPISINRASEEQLQALPDIGPVLASRIVGHRNHHGPFRRIEDLADIKGIGAGTLAKLAPYITL